MSARVVSFASPKVSHMSLATATSRGARRGAAAALRWIQPRRESPLAPARWTGRFESAHASAHAAQSASAAPHPQSSDQPPAPPSRPRAPAPPAQAQRAQAQQPRPHQSRDDANWHAQQQQQRGGGGGGGAARPAAAPRQPQPQSPQTPHPGRAGYNNNATPREAPRASPFLPEEVDALYHRMQHLGSRWADLHAEAELLEESKKCVLATITLHYMNDGDNKSAGEAKAFAAPEYKEHVTKMVEARRRANQAKVEFEGIKTHMNLTRTYEASRREEMKML